MDVRGTLVAQDVTFTRGRTGIFVNGAASATLNNVLFEDIISRGNGFGVNGLLNVYAGSNVTLNNAVFRKVFNNGVNVIQGGTLTTTGCLAFYGSPAYDVIHSEVWDGGGTWNDNSTGPCSGEIGNKGQALLPAPALMDCGLPAGALVDEDVTWTLRSDCAGVGQFFIGEGTRVRIVGNGHRITGSPQAHALFSLGGNATLDMDNLVLDKVRLFNLDGALTLTRSEFRNATSTSLVNFGRSASFSNTLFEDNSSASFASLFYGSNTYSASVTTFRDVIFRNNSGGDRMAVLYRSATLNLEGCIVMENNQMPEFEAVSGTLNDARDNCDDPPVVGPAPPVTGWNPHGPPERDPSRDCFQSLGAIGLICRVILEPGPTIEVWGVTPESRGHFILRVMRAEIDAIQPEGLVACSADGRVALRVHRDRSITFSMGPEPQEGKTHHVTMQNHLNDHVIGTFDTFDGRPCDPAALLPPAPTPALAAFVTPQAPRADGSIIHVVQEGDTIWAITEAYGLMYPHEIVERNDLADKGRWLTPGQELFIREGR
ncbi:MAG: LysM domain-containing protein [Anaerolineaceae bacterium]|nr:LysM domain-containing protein [Anaerolineaceae bacterium]